MHEMNGSVGFETISAVCDRVAWASNRQPQHFMAAPLQLQNLSPDESVADLWILCCQIG